MNKHGKLLIDLTYGIVLKESMPFSREDILMTIFIFKRRLLLLQFALVKKDKFKILCNVKVHYAQSSVSSVLK